VTPFPWTEAMRIGFGVLRLSPEDFWRMTPRELMAAASGLYSMTGHGKPLSRARFDELLKRYPDKEHQGG
jgi:uncharacterized phage protein (TIGR02216 family)